jgi:hypothetical protein
VDADDVGAVVLDGVRVAEDDAVFVVCRRRPAAHGVVEPLDGVADALVEGAVLAVAARGWAGFRVVPGPALDVRLSRRG